MSWIEKYDPFFNLQNVNISQLVKTSGYQSISQFLDPKQRKFFFCWCSISMCHVLTNCIYVKFYFFNCYLAAPRPTLGHFWGDNLTHPMLITAFLHFRAEGHREPCNEFGSLSQAELLVLFEPGTFRFLLRRLNPLGHSPRKCMSHTQNVKFYKLPYLIIFITSTLTTTTFQFPKY